MPTETQKLSDLLVQGFRQAHAFIDDMLNATKGSVLDTIWALGWKNTKSSKIFSRKHLK